MTTKPIRFNPPGVIPVGRYSHVTIVPRNAQLYTFSGQIGTDEKGNLPESYEAQIANTFNNIRTVIASQGLTPDDIIKVNIWAIEELDWDHVFDPLWDQFFGEVYPSMTVAYISALGLPEIQIEIEVWAAKA